MAKQAESVARGILSPESSQHHEPSCNFVGFCRRDLSSGVPRGNSSQELTTARNAWVLSSQVVLVRLPPPPELLIELFPSLKKTKLEITQTDNSSTALPICQSCCNQRSAPTSSFFRRCCTQDSAITSLSNCLEFGNQEKVCTHNHIRKSIHPF